MEESQSTMRLKLKFKSRNKNSITSEQQLNALRTAMSLINGNELCYCSNGEDSNGKNSYKVKGMTFDHDLSTLEIILQKDKGV